MMTRLTPAAVFGLVCLAYASSAAGASAGDNPPTVTPGNILRFDLGPAEPPAPQARFGDQWLLVTQERNRWVVLLGVDLTTVPGSYLLAVNNHPTTDTLLFHVRARRDPVMRRSTAEARTLDAEALVEAELQRIQASLGKKPGGTARLPLWRPAPARLVDRFGTRQILPDGSYRPVRYVSFVLDSDTAVRSPTDGKVLGIAEIGHGRLVAIDHGQGLLSVLWPLHETRVKAGETLKQGSTVGFNLVAGGTKGELDWALLMNRAWVHPLALVEEPKPVKSSQTEPPRPGTSKEAASTKRQP